MENYSIYSIPKFIAKFKEKIDQSEIEEKGDFIILYVNLDNKTPFNLFKISEKK